MGNMAIQCVQEEKEKRGTNGFSSPCSLVEQQEMVFASQNPLLHENALFTPKWDGNPELHTPSVLMGTGDFLQRSFLGLIVKRP